MDHIALQIAETKTRSEKVEIRTEQEKGIANRRNKVFKADNKTIPPGPGQYTLPSDVNCI
jgi:hypothetical protein